MPKKNGEFFTKQELQNKLDGKGKDNIVGMLSAFSSMLHRVQRHKKFKDNIREFSHLDSKMDEFRHGVSDLQSMMLLKDKSYEEKSQTKLANLKSFLREPVYVDGKEVTMYQLMKDILNTGELAGFNAPPDKAQDLDNGLNVLDQLLELNLNVKKLNPDYKPELPFKIKTSEEVAKEEEERRRQEEEEERKREQERRDAKEEKQRVIREKRKRNPTVPDNETFQKRFGSIFMRGEFENEAKKPYEVFKSIQESQSYQNLGGKKVDEEFKEYLNTMNDLTTFSNAADIDKICDFKEFLRKDLGDGRTVYSRMKMDRQLEGKEALQEFYNALAFYDETLNLDLNIKELDQEYEPNRVAFDFEKRAAKDKWRQTKNEVKVQEQNNKAEPGRNGKPKSWNNYALDHLERKPKDDKEAVDFFAKAIVGKFKTFQAFMNPDAKGAKEPFSVKKAREYAEQLKGSSFFKQFCKDPQRVRKYLETKDPDELFHTGLNLQEPFHNTDPEKTRQVLQNLKRMADRMDPSQRRSEKWKKMVASLKSIDLNDPEASGEKKLKEIYENTVAYNKGKKKLRSNQEEQERFDQSLDILAELGKTGEFAKNAAEVVFDRVNEVRGKTNRVSMDSFGAQRTGAAQDGPQKRDQEQLL